MRPTASDARAPLYLQAEDGLVKRREQGISVGPQHGGSLWGEALENAAQRRTRWFGRRVPRRRTSAATVDVLSTLMVRFGRTQPGPQRSRSKRAELGAQPTESDTTQQWSAGTRTEFMDARRLPASSVILTTRR